jgi:carbonic anhydrase/acetyltransferase-like protein (isoleucine patch superfamily)
MNHSERLTKYLGKKPEIAEAIFVAPTSTILGDVVLAADSSVFYGAVLRADINEIRVGRGTNIQDNAVIHHSDTYPAIIGEYCTIGHAAIIHACTIEDECLIGMGASVLDGAVIGSQSIIGANSLVPQRFVCPPRSMVYGSPAKVIRALTESEIASLKYSALKYIEVAKAHLALNKNV